MAFAFIQDKPYLQVYPEGTHLMIPWFERPIIYDVRARPNLVESTSGSRDLQMVTSLFLVYFLFSRNCSVDVVFPDILYSCQDSAALLCFMLFKQVGPKWLRYFYLIA